MTAEMPTALEVLLEAAMVAMEHAERLSMARRTRASAQLLVLARTLVAEVEAQLDAERRP